MSDMKWEDPEPDVRAGDKFAEFAAALRANPGKWALIPGWERMSGDYAVTTNVKQGRFKAFRPAGTFDSTSRKQPDGTRKTYVRYVGPGYHG